MPNFPVSEAKQQALLQSMQKYGVHEEDLDEQFITGGGPGGQKINKTASCVLLTHRPSGFQVKCQKTRSQALNRYLARRILVDMIAQKIEGKKSEEERRREKIRRQKRRRSRRAKEKMLYNKKKQTEKKQHRKKENPWQNNG